MFVFASLALTALALAFLFRAVASRRGALFVAVGVFAILFLVIGFLFLDALTGSGIDESVFFHIGIGLKGAAIVDYAEPIALAAGALLLAAVAAFAVSRLVRDPSGRGAPGLRRTAGIAALVGALAVNPAVVDVFALFQKYGLAPDERRTELPPPEGFVPGSRATFPDGKKNVVILYLESIERTFLDNSLFPGLAPNLSALETEALSFTDILQPSWASWTIAGMVSSQCGMPIPGSGAGSDEFLPGATCLGDLLHAAGYDLSYLGGASLDFAGKGTFYRTHGFETVEGRDELRGELENPDYTSVWGIYDDSLFEMAKRRFDRLAEADEPFGLTLITVDTHHPSGGIVSASCEGMNYRDGGLKFLNAVHCADRMAGDFIRHVLASPAMDNTVLIVMSDHMARPNAASDELEQGDRRNLMLAFGAGIEPGTIDRPGTTLDAGPTILTLLGAETGAIGYGRNLLGTEPTLRMSSTNIDGLMSEHWAFLSSLWAFPQLTDGLRVDAGTERALLGERYVKLPAFFELDETLTVTDVVYDMDKEARLAEQILGLWYGARFLWIDRCDEIARLERVDATDGGAFCGLAGSLGSPGLTALDLSGGQKVDYAALQAIFSPIAPSADHYAMKVAEVREAALYGGAKVHVVPTPEGWGGEIAIRSAGGGSKAGRTYALNRDAGERLFLRRGLTLLGLNADEVPRKLAYKDTCGWGGEQFDADAGLETDFATVIDGHRSDYAAFVIVSHSSTVCYEVDPNLDAVFGDAGLSAFRDLWYEQPYIALVSSDGAVREFVGDRNTALAVELRNVDPVTGGEAAQ